MFSQGNGAGRFAIATDKEKKEILENLVHLDIYAKAQAVAKERLKKKEEEIALKEQENPVRLGVWTDRQPREAG